MELKIKSKLLQKKENIKIFFEVLKLKVCRLKKKFSRDIITEMLKTVADAFLFEIINL